MRYLQVVHTIPNRTRLRCPSLRTALADGERLADALAAVPGVDKVSIRPFTGSILVAHEPQVAVVALIDVANDVLAFDQIVGLGEQPPIDEAMPQLSKIARLAAAAFRDINRDVLRASEGSLDLGTLATLGFLSAGAVQLALEHEIELPPWFNLAWWGYRTFMTNEQEAIASLDGGSSASDSSDW